jgi:hypothetical protein
MQANYKHILKVDILRPKYVDRHLCSTINSFIFNCNKYCLKL